MKFSKNSYWIQSGIYTTLQKFAIIFFNFGGFYFLVRTYSKTEFGIYALFITIFYLIETARAGLIRNSQVKFLASEPEEEHPFINTASLVMNVVFTLATSVITVAIASYLTDVFQAPNLDTMLYYSLLTSFALIPSTQFEFIQHARGDFKGVFIATIARYGTIFLFILISYLIDFNYSLVTLVNVQTVAALIGSLVSYLAVRKGLEFSASLSKEWFNKIFHYGKYTFGTNVSAMVNKNIDQYMIGYILKAPAFIATYTTALRVSTLIEAPTLSVATIVFPQSAKRMQTEGPSAVKYLYEKSVGILIAIMLPPMIFVLVFPKFIIQVIAGENYLDTVPILQVTIIYSFFVPYARQFGTVLDSIGKPKINFYFVIFGACLTALFDYLYISHFGLIGAVYGTLTTYAIVFTINQIILKRLMDIRTLNTFMYARNFYIDLFNFAVTKMKLGGLQINIKN
ncbi:MAG: flippase [Sporocytophaga sp.]|nr:flippase [Sporocytophaga sp.]